MKQHLRNSRVILLGIVLMSMLPCLVLAQDSLFQAKFQQNINALNDLYCWEDVTFYPGAFSFNSKIDFSDEFRKNTLFAQQQPRAAGYYQILEQLSLHEKQQLIRFFSYHQEFMETRLKEAGLPKELKYLAATLSAMNPLAVGNNKRAGMWQLTHFQGMLNGLQITRLIDERYNAEMASVAAVKQLKKNTALFKSTELAILGYFVGNAKIRNTLMRCGKNAPLSELLKDLPASVGETIAAFQAMAVFLRVNTFAPTTQIVAPDVVAINRQLHFQQIAQVLNISEKQLQFLNPQYVYFIIPASEKEMVLHIPAGKHDAFVLRIDSIYNAYDSTLFQVVAQKIEYAPAPNRQYIGEKVKDLQIEGKTKIKYSIKSGDVLGLIAEDYDVRVADLKYWNNIYNERRIQVGQKLDIFVDNENASYYSDLNAEAKKTAKPIDMVAKLTKSTPIPVFKITDSTKKVEHVVKSGESPYVIAHKYTGVTPEEILEWNGITDARRIQIGQTLIIYLAQ